MKCETIKYDNNKELTIIDGAVNVEQCINLYFDCSTLTYRITIVVLMKFKVLQIKD